MKLRRDYGKQILIVGSAFAIGGIIRSIIKTNFDIDSILYSAAGILCVAFALYLIYCPPLSYFIYERKNLNLHFPDNIDYKHEIESVRENYAKEQKVKKNFVPMAFSYAKNYFDNSVWTDGKIYYAALVQANDKLFKKSYKDPVLPGVVVYSPDSFFDEHPEELIKISDKLYDDRENNFLQYETEYKNHVLLSVDYGRHETYATTIMFYRKHMPVGLLSGRVFPIIVKKDCVASFMVNSKYWTDSLKADFIGSSYILTLKLATSTEDTENTQNSEQ